MQLLYARQDYEYSHDIKFLTTVLGSSPLTTRAAVFYAIQTFGLDLSRFQDVCGVTGMAIITASDRMCKMVPPLPNDINK